MLKCIFVNANILISSYKISIFAFTKIVLEQRYLDLIADLKVRFIHGLQIQIMYYFFLVTGSSISTSASAVTAASTTSTTSTSSGNKPPRPKWLHCNNCKSPFANAWDLMVHVQTAHMMNIYQLADTTKLQNVRFFSFSFLQKQNR